MYSVGEAVFRSTGNPPLERDFREFHIVEVLRFLPRIHRGSLAYDCGDFLGGIAISRLHNHVPSCVQTILNITRADAVLIIENIVRQPRFHSF